MASVKDFYKKKLLAAKDLGNKPIIGKITMVTPETKQNAKGVEITQLVIELDDGDYRIQLNKTNALSLGKELGDDFDTWLNKKVKITKIRTTFNNSPCDGLAVHKA